MVMDLNATHGNELHLFLGFGFLKCKFRPSMGNIFQYLSYQWGKLDGKLGTKCFNTMCSLYTPQNSVKLNLL